ncbi:MAG: DUF2461 domain-containing protein [Bacteroidota bacterium]
MIQRESIQFLYDLRANNTKEWFDTNRKHYEQTRENFVNFVDALLKKIEVFDVDVAVSLLDPKKTMMRINRDIRFSKDKTPYNSHLFTYINEGGKRTPNAGYFFSLDPGKSFYGAGTYKPPTEVINMIRQEIDYNPKEWEGIVNDSQLKSSFGEVICSDMLSRPPKGYEKDHELLDWIKRKDFHVQKFISDEELLDEELVNRVAEGLKAAHALVHFQNRALK